MTNIYHHQAGTPASKGGEFKAHVRAEDTVELELEGDLLNDEAIIIFQNAQNRQMRLEASETGFGSSFSHPAVLAGLRAVIAADRATQAALAAEAGPNLEQFSADDLPPYPEELVPATVSFGLGDDNPIIYNYFAVGGDDVTVWRDEDAPDGWTNSIRSSDEETGWGEDTDDEFIAWAIAVSERIETNAHRTYYSALPPNREADIVAAALGRTAS